MKNSFYKIIGYMLVLSTAQTGCGGDTTPTPANPTISPGSDPNFTIVSHTDEGFSSFNRKVVVFGIDIYAVQAVEDAKLLHAANVMAQYLDNNEDGTVDNPTVLNTMVANKAFMVMWKTQNDINITPPAGRMGQDLGNDETRPEWHGNKSGNFDASLEEVMHIIYNAGYASAYPDDLGPKAGTAIANAMDAARGGHFTSIPGTYPAGAWYTYDDTTCDYNCQVSEYQYWALTSILGAQENRLDEIGREWTLNTAEKVRTTDAAVYALMTNDTYQFATTLPDGTYKR